MAKTVATIMGVIFLLVGLAGFVFPSMMGMHLSWTHNAIHLISGALSLYFGLAGTIGGAKVFDYFFGAFYLLLGFVGYMFGLTSDSTLPANVTEGAYNERMFHAVRGFLELGTIDHAVHVLIGLVFIVAAYLTRANLTRFFEGTPE